MEVKKSYEADLEHQWKKRFLLGVVLVLAVLAVALEFNFRDVEVEYKEDMIAVIEEPEEKPAPPTRINPVDEPVMMDATDRLVENRQELFEGETEAAEQEKVPPIPPVAIDADNNPLNFRVVERLPEFPGGMTEFMKWLTKNLRYPTVARNNHTQGKVVAVFYVEKDGSISGVKITKSLSPECDKEALRVLNMMPHWQPGVYHDQPCRTKVCIPIVFKL